MEQLKGLYLDQVNIADIVIASKVGPMEGQREQRGSLPAPCAPLLDVCQEPLLSTKAFGVSRCTGRSGVAGSAGQFPLVGRKSVPAKGELPVDGVLVGAPPAVGSVDVLGGHAIAPDVLARVYWQMAVHTMAKGGLDFNLLNADASHKSPPLQLHEPHVHGAHSRWVELGRGSAPTAGQPSRVVASGDGGSAAGWVFSAEDTFQVGALGCCHSACCPQLISNPRPTSRTPSNCRPGRVNQ